MNLRPAPRWLTVFVMLGLAPALARPALAAILHVPAEHSTVREAAEAAASGDTVLIAPGIHPGGLYLRDKALTFASWFLLAGDTSYVAQTVIDSVYGDPCGGYPGCAGNAVLEFAKTAGGSSVVGLTVQRGMDGVRSRGIVDISFCHVVGNADGIDYQSGSGGLIRASLFAYNTDDGIDINGRTEVRVIGNLICDNHQDGIEFRLYPYSGTPLLVEFIGNRILRNGGDGIQLIDYPDTSDRVIRIERNLFQFNRDAAIGCMPDSLTSEDFQGVPIPERVYVIRNTFHDEHYGLVGGANVIALDNLFEGITETALRRVGGGSIASYSLFWDNHRNYEDSNVDLPHMVHVDPFVNDDGSLPAGSDAIDAGVAWFQWGEETVLDLPAGAYVGAAPDLGAFEYGVYGGGYGGLPDGNLPPVIDAGPDQTLTLPADAALHGRAGDDWLPYPSTCTVAWSVASGPGPVSFADSSALDTGASFAFAGDYLLRLTVGDGALASVDSVHLTVNPALAPGTLIFDRRIANASDDQEETPTGTISPNTGDLELVLGPTVQTIGLRFSAVTLPPGATVTSAHIQFEADEIQSDPTYLVLRGEAAADPGPFTLANFDISSRPRTESWVAWSPVPWTVVGQQGADQRTPDLSAIVQEVIDGPGWASGNAMAFIITGSGHRTARSFEGDSVGAALLHVEAIEMVTGVGDTPSIGLALRRVSPSPSRGVMRVDLSLEDSGFAVLELVDLAGRRVAARALRGLPAGSHSVELRERLPAGVYLVRLTQGGRARVMKTVVLN